MLGERWATFQWVSAGDVVIVLDASHSAADYRTEILRLAGELVRLLPPSSDARLGFLGGAELYPASGFAEHSGRWWRENAGRCSLLNPVLRVIEFGPNAGPVGGHSRRIDDLATWTGRLVVIGSGRIYDLADWAGRLGERLFLVSVGQPLTPAGSTGIAITTRRAEEVAVHLCDPVARITLGAPGFVPLGWDNPHYQLVLGAHDARLTWEPPEDSLVHVGFVGSGTPPVARIRYSDGREVERPLADASPLDMELPCAGLLSADDAAFYYQCKSLSTAEVSAAAKRACGQVLPQWTGFALLADSREGLRVFAYPWPVIRLGAQQLGIYSRPHRRVLTWDASAAGWKTEPDASFPGWASVAEGVRVVAL